VAGYHAQNRPSCSKASRFSSCTVRAQTHEQTFAVTAVPDEKEGERLVVLHTLPVDRLQTCFEKLPEAGLANLWLPRTNAFFRVSSLPYLGTGKIDLRKIRELALELSKPHVPLQTHFT
jgi:acyl-CoA synthetase (AMP-forming)/AMP-acid ligase II